MKSNTKLVLMSCCAPCSCGAIKQLANHEIDGIDDFIVMFFNPNIFPESEYQKRLKEQVKYCENMGVKYIIGDYNHQEWRDNIRGLEDEPERGARCSKCFAFRFCMARKFAIKNGYNAISSVFGVSRHKSQSQVDEAGKFACNDIRYISIKWDEKLRVQTNKESNFYRQNYCGCEFSMHRI